MFSHTLLLMHSHHPLALLDINPYWIYLAQTFQDNLGNDISKSWNHFIQSGQVWALGIGFILGYIARSLTAY